MNSQINNGQQTNSAAITAKENIINANNQIQLQSSQRYGQAQSISSIQSMRFNPQKERTIQTATAKGEKTTACTSTKSENSNNKVYEILFAQIAEENNSLYEIIQRVSKQRDTAQSKVLINEQIAEGIENQEKELINEYSEKLVNLNRIIQEQQSQIQILLNQNPKGQIFPGTFIRYREIVLAKDSELRINNRLESSLTLVKSLQEKVQTLEEEKNELIFINGVVSQELEKIRKQNYTKMQYNNQKQQSFQNREININDDQQQFQVKAKQGTLTSSRDMDNQDKAINKINKVINMETGESEELFVPDVIPERVQLIKDDQNQNKVKIPQLDLTKAKKIQEINLQKQLEMLKQKEQMQATQQLKQQISKDNQVDLSNSKNLNQSSLKINELDMKLLEKYKIVENEMFKARAFLEEEILKQQSIQKFLDESLRKIEELEAVNKTLIESNMLFQQKWKRLWDSYMFYREYYMRDSRKTCKQKRNQSIDSNIKQSNQNKDGFNQMQPNFLFATQNYEYQYCQGNNIQLLNDYYSPESLCRQANKKNQQIFMIQSPKYQQNRSSVQQNIFQSPQQINEKQLQIESELLNQQVVQPITESQLLEMASEYFLSQRQNKIPSIYEQRQNNQNQNDNKAAIVNMALELYLDTQRRQILQKLSEGKKFRKRSKSLDFIHKVNTSVQQDNIGKKHFNLKKLKENGQKIRFPSREINQNSQFQDSQNIENLKKVQANHIHRCCICNEDMNTQCNQIQKRQQNILNNETFQIFDELAEQLIEQEKTIPKNTNHHSFGLNNQQKKEQILVENNYQYNGNENKIILGSLNKIQKKQEFVDQGVQMFSGDILSSIDNINVSPEEVRISIMPNHYNKYFKTDIDHQQKNNFDYLQDELENLTETFISSHQSHVIENNNKNKNLNENHQVPYFINIIQPLSNLENQVSARNSSQGTINNQQIPCQNQEVHNSNSNNAIKEQQNICCQQTEQQNNECLIQNEFKNSHQENSANKFNQTPSEKLISNEQEQIDQNNNSNIFNNITNGSGDKSEILQENKFSSNIPFHPQEQRKMQEYRHHFDGQLADDQANNQLNDFPIKQEQIQIQNKINQDNQLGQEIAISRGEINQENQNNSNNYNTKDNNSQEQKANTNIDLSNIQLIVFD